MVLEIVFYSPSSTHDIRQTTVQLIQAVQSDPNSPLDLIKSMDINNINVTVVSGNIFYSHILLYPHSPSGWYIGIPLSVRPSVRNFRHKNLSSHFLD